jgi:hypothetical protein
LSTTVLPVFSLGLQQIQFADEAHLDSSSPTELGSTSLFDLGIARGFEERQQ